MNNSFKIKRMVGIASLAAIAAVLQYVSQFITFGPFNITLALTPIVVGAILYGPVGGSILGLIVGIVILVSGQAQAFLVISPVGTIFTVLLKSTLAGLASGFVFLGLKKKNPLLGTVLASLIVPIVNTGIFALSCMTVLYNALLELANGANTMYFLFISMIGINFLFEFAINSLLSPALYQIVKIFATKLHISAYFNLKDNNEETSSDK